MIIELLWNIISKRKHLKNTILPYEILHLLYTVNEVYNEKLQVRKHWKYF